MAWHGGLKKRKKTGGKRRTYRTKRRHEAGGYPAETRLGDTERGVEAGRSGITKARLLHHDMANVSDRRTGRTERLQILEVVRNPANVDYNRRGVLTKGTIIRTERGLAEVSSRPGQDGMLNAITREER
ncbi:30S ribosomal protein S8e [miscellaneous Crenarchaeota group-15 archaeon DG-45]|uniref:Small ribosomal subunit protein eS8 n=1 Tax=miscellaneous Crenarchaeota group-15 archaeon DG-45 TaxID=1685127 RepID=A0A0M0BPW6_9ARCH|nr:MAG: 30S ribosomal protein S8e [miscellaneous Crenarchaeota group-15 archaeon DG-45]